MKKFISALHAAIFDVLRHTGMLAALRPDWDGAPGRWRPLLPYALVLACAVWVSTLVEFGLGGAPSLQETSIESLSRILGFHVRVLPIAVVFAFLGRLVSWNCVARSSSSFVLMAMFYCVGILGQALRVLVLVGFDDFSAVMEILGLAIQGLAIFVLVDYYRPRRRRRPRRKPQEGRSGSFSSTTYPAPLSDTA